MRIVVALTAMILVSGTPVLAQSNSGADGSAPGQTESKSPRSGDQGKTGSDREDRTGPNAKGSVAGPQTGSGGPGTGSTTGASTGPGSGSSGSAGDPGATGPVGGTTPRNAEPTQKR